MKTVEERLSQIEARLETIERLLPAVPMRGAEAQSQESSQKDSMSESESTSDDQAATAWTQTPTSPSAQTPRVRRMIDPNYGSPKNKSDETKLPITQIMGWTGASALVLAIAYLIRLALDAGWLTPERQLVLAVLSGFGLIGAGLKLRAADRQYASLLPAGGLVVLFLSVYGAHLYYHFIGATFATGAVIITCLGALWLSRLFESELYALFAVVGSYSAPFMLEALSGSVTDLVIYFSAWSVLFCLYAIWIGNRRTYLLAAYLALLGFHALWKHMAPGEWGAAFAFQTLQFAIFLAGAIWFSVRHHRPMSNEETLAHLPLLLIFYVLQYWLLENHVPTLAPWIALGSVAVLLAGHLVAKHLLGALSASSMLISAYAALALFHAGYMELLPDEFAPWLALLLLPALGLYIRSRGNIQSLNWPMRALIVVIYAINYQRVVLGSSMASVPAHDLLAVLYAVSLYVAYALIRRLPDMKEFAIVTLYVGHIAMMSAVVQVFEGRLAVSLTWSIVALACLALSFRIRDEKLGKSSLLIFAASAAKVMLFDLSHASPTVRIALLVVLGITLYAGGWMYKKVDQMATG